MLVSQDEQDGSEVRIEETRAEIQEALDRVHELVSEAKRDLGAGITPLRRQSRRRN